MTFFKEIMQVGLILTVIAYGANITLRNSILAGGYVSTLNMTFPADMGRKTYPIVMRYKSPMNVL